MNTTWVSRFSPGFQSALQVAVEDHVDALEDTKRRGSFGKATDALLCVKRRSLCSVGCPAPGAGWQASLVRTEIPLAR